VEKVEEVVHNYVPVQHEPVAKKGTKATAAKKE
jgi:hypothetical protein